MEVELKVLEREDEVEVKVKMGDVWGMKNGMVVGIFVSRKRVGRGGEGRLGMIQLCEIGSG